MDILLIAIFLGIFTLISNRRVVWGLYLIIFLLPTYLIRAKLGFIPFTFLEGMILILAAVWFFKKIKNKQLIKTLQVASCKLQVFRWPIILFLVAAAISVFVSPNRLSALGDFRAFFVEPLIFFVIFLDLVRSEKEIHSHAKQSCSVGVKNIFYALGGCAIYISLFVIFQIFTDFLVPGNYLKEGRMTSFYGYPAGVGLFLAPILAMFIGVIIGELKTQSAKRKAKTQNSKLNVIPSEEHIRQAQCGLRDESRNLTSLFFSLAVVILSTLALLATKTEGAYLGVLAAAFLILMLTPWRKWIIFSTLLVSIVILAIPASRHYVIQKITFSDVSGDVRLVLWQGTWRAIIAHPIFGGGLSGFPDLYKQYKEKKHVELLKYPHNIIFNFWTETGILGLISFFWLIFAFFRKISLSYKLQVTSYKLTLAAAMIALLVYGLLDVPYFKNDLSVLFWVLIALSII
ncbi:MAG: O-antigen ligase family protein [Patescibacteria group bacterium]